MHTATLHKRPGEDSGDGTQTKTIARCSLCWTPRSSSAFERGSVSDGQCGGLGDGCGLQKVFQMVFRRSARWSAEGPPKGPLEGLHTVFRRSTITSSEGQTGLQKVHQKVLRRSTRTSESPPEGLQKVYQVFRKSARRSSEGRPCCSTAGLAALLDKAEQGAEVE